MTPTEKLALALQAIEAAKEAIGLLVGVAAAAQSGYGVADAMMEKAERYQEQFNKAVTKLEQAK